MSYDKKHTYASISKYINCFKHIRIFGSCIFNALNFLVEVEIYYLATINKPRAKFDVEQSE